MTIPDAVKNAESPTSLARIAYRKSTAAEAAMLRTLAAVKSDNRDDAYVAALESCYASRIAVAAADRAADRAADEHADYARTHANNSMQYARRASDAVNALDAN